MKINLSFAEYFKSITGIAKAQVELPEGATVGDAIDMFLKNNPEYFKLLDRKKLFLLGEFRAIYHIDRLAVNSDHILSDGDDLKILKAFIGG